MVTWNCILALGLVFLSVINCDFIVVVEKRCQQNESFYTWVQTSKNLTPRLRRQALSKLNLDDPSFKARIGNEPITADWSPYVRILLSASTFNKFGEFEELQFQNFTAFYFKADMYSKEYETLKGLECTAIEPITYFTYTQHGYISPNDLNSYEFPFEISTFPNNSIFEYESKYTNSLAWHFHDPEGDYAYYRETAVGLGVFKAIQALEKTSYKTSPEVVLIDPTCTNGKYSGINSLPKGHAGEIISLLTAPWYQDSQIPGLFDQLWVHCHQVLNYYGDAKIASLDLLRAYADVVKEHKNIVSLHTYSISETTKSISLALRELSTGNNIMVVSAGNGACDIDALQYTEHYCIPDHDPGFPVKLPRFADSNILVVGANTLDGTRWSPSNYGQHSVDVFAPGYLLPVEITKGKTDFISGTSYSAALAAGVVSILRSIAVPQVPVNLLSILKTVQKSDKLYGLCSSAGYMSIKNAMKYFLGKSARQAYVEKPHKTEMQEISGLLTETEPDSLAQSALQTSSVTAWILVCVIIIALIITIYFLAPTVIALLPVATNSYSPLAAMTEMSVFYSSEAAIAGGAAAGGGGGSTIGLLGGAAAIGSSVA